MNKITNATKDVKRLKFLNRKGEKILKGLHLFFVALTVGGLFSILVLFILKNSDRADEFIINWSIFYIFGRIVYYAFLGNFITGLTYSLFTRWGFFRVHWVTVKWIGFILVFLFMAFGVEPSFSGLVALSDSGQFLAEGRLEYLTLWNKALISTIGVAVILIALLFISTIKPWKAGKKDLISNLKRARIILLTIVFIFGAWGIIQLFRLVSLESHAHRRN